MATARVRAEISARAVRDRDWGAPQDVLAARVRAVAGAQRAVLERSDEAAQYALRAALVDLAAICELTAAELAPPGLDREGWRERHRELARRGLVPGEIERQSPFTRATVARDVARVHAHEPAADHRQNGTSSNGTSSALGE